VDPGTVETISLAGATGMLAIVEHLLPGRLYIALQTALQYHIIDAEEKRGGNQGFTYIVVGI
jgi:hypothetical protein